MMNYSNLFEDTPYQSKPKEVPKSYEEFTIWLKKQATKLLLNTSKLKQESIECPLCSETINLKNPTNLFSLQVYCSLFIWN